MNRSYRKAHKLKLRRERIRLEKHQSRLERVQAMRMPFPDDWDADEETIDPGFPPYLIERSFWEEEQPANPDDPKFQAQMLAFDAMELGDEDGASELARRALELDPHCVDALTVLASDPRSTQEQKLSR